MKKPTLCLVLPIVGIFLALTAQQALAQSFSRDAWHPGTVDLNTGEHLTGLVKYNLEIDNLLVQLDGTIKSFSSTQVESFQIQDYFQGYTRNFYSLPHATDGAYKKNIFFELLLEGHVTLLAREKVIEKIDPIGMPHAMGFRTVTRLVQVDDFFFLDKNFVLKEIRPKSDDLLSAMQDRKKSVEKFLSKNKVNLELREDMATVVEYYNSLFDF